VDLSAVDFAGSRKAFDYELQNCDPDLKESALSYFDSTFKKSIFKTMDGLEGYSESVKRVCRSIPYNLPRRFGGLGLDGQPSAFDLYCAQRMIDENWSMPQKEKTWIFHDLLLKELSKYSVPTDHKVDNSYADLYWYILSSQREKVWIRQNKESRGDTRTEKDGVDGRNFIFLSPDGVKNHLDRPEYDGFIRQFHIRNELRRDFKRKRIHILRYSPEEVRARPTAKEYVVKAVTTYL
jgi:hypothetical protein